MQRLFSTFADGPPGAGLLLQRLLTGAALLYCLVATPLSGVAPAQLIGAFAGLLLIAGLWTPVAGVIAACAEAWIALTSPAPAGIAVALAVLCVSLALIGPGQWSVDARLYGRKHFVPPELNTIVWSGVSKRPSTSCDKPLSGPSPPSPYLRGKSVPGPREESS